MFAKKWIAWLVGATIGLIGILEPGKTNDEPVPLNRPILKEPNREAVGQKPTNTIEEARRWEADEFKYPEFALFNFPQRPNRPYTHELTVLNVVIFRNAYWHRPGVERQLDKASEIIGKCKVLFRYAKFTFVDVPTSWLDASASTSTSRTIMTKIPITERPLVVFGFSFPTADLTFRYGVAFVTPNSCKSKTCDVAFVFTLALFEDSKTIAAAHELGHVLGKLEHVRDDEKGRSNLMHPSTPGQELTPEQCDAIRRHPSLKRIAED